MNDTRGRRARALVGFGVGVALLAAAVWAVAGSGDALAQAVAAARSAPAWTIGLAILLPLVNVILMAGVFHELMRPYGRVEPGEMGALIAASWLLNFLPLRPGLLGRVAYHKSVNNIPVAGSVRAVVGNIAAGFVALALGTALVFGAPAGSDPALVPLGFTAGAAALPATLALLGLMLRTAGHRGATLMLASALRFVDLLVWCLRYWLIFRIVGSPIDAPAALAVAVVSQAASLVPIVGNGLGLREWAVGLTVAALPGVFASGAGTGLAADLVNRAAEVVAAVPAGLFALAYLHRLSRARRAAPQTP